MSARLYTLPIAFGLTFALAIPLNAAPQRNFTVEILHSEPVLDLAWTEASALERGAADAPAVKRLRFDAYARTFQLTLEPNVAPVLSRAALGDDNAQFYRGKLEGSADSWVRLSLADGNLRGLIWDGVQLYVLEPAEWLGLPLVELPRETSGELVIFRLADARIDPGAMSCPVGTDPARISAAAAFDQLRQEFDATQFPLRRIDVGLIADFEAYTLIGDSTLLILLRDLNEVDGIFSSQVGVQLVGTRTQVFRDAADPFPTQTKAADVLQGLHDYRAAADSLRDVGVVHMVSGQAVFDVAGIAYLDSICDLAASVGLTIVGQHAWWSKTLVMAHELGHNFGAPHDSEGACADTPADRYLMSPTFPDSDVFSDCSLQQIARTMARVSCLDPQHPGADGHLWIPDETRLILNQHFPMSVGIANLGSESLRDVLLQFTVPTAVFVNSVESDSFACTSGGGAGPTLRECTLAELPAGRYETITIVGRTLERTVTAMQFELLASNDSDTANNSAALPLRIQPYIDLSPAIRGQGSLRRGSLADYTVRVSNPTDFEATDVIVDVTVTDGLAIRSATGGTCSLRPAGAECRLDQVPAGGSDVVARVEALTEGSQSISATVSGAEPDNRPLNNGQTYRVEVAPPLPPESDKGGGGVLSLFGLLVALLTVIHRRARGNGDIPHFRREISERSFVP